MPPTTEQRARERIDGQLAAAGWLLQDNADFNRNAAEGVAVREFVLPSGPCDYLLFVGGKACGVIEAKKAGVTLSGVAEQAARYQVALPPHLARWADRLRFDYESTSEETFFRDGLDPQPRSRRVFAFHQPATLHAWLNEADTLRGRLRRMPALDAHGLRDCQVSAVQGLEASLAVDHPRSLLQMATGAGKTFTACTFSWRLLKHAKARRILFLVDRNNLGDQTLKEYQNYEPPGSGRKFDRTYIVQHLHGSRVDPDAKVVVTTIQRLYAMLRGEDLDEAAEEVSAFETWSGTDDNGDLRPIAYNPALPIEFFDLIGRRDLSQKGFDSCSARLMPAGAVLLSSRAPVGYSVVASNQLCTNQGFKSFVLKDDQLIPEYLRYYLSASKQYLESEASGTTFLELSGARAEQLLFPIAPRDEQVRIVSKIDQLFSRIEEGERALERVQTLVERYRQSVLKAAVTGELTREWREQLQGQLESGEALLQRILKVRRELGDGKKRKFKEPARIAGGPLPPCPAGWAWASVEQAGEVRLGRQRAPQHQSGDHMRPYLRVANVYEDRLDLSDVKEMNFTPEEFETYALRPGDLLLNEGQSPELVGRPAMYRGEVAGCCYQKTLLRFRAHSGVLPEFALMVFRSYLHSGRFRRSASITTSIAHLAAERFVGIEFPLPSEAEQAQIVDVATSKLSEIEHLAQDLATQREAAARLRQSVLGAAFCGTLAPSLAPVTA